MIEQWIKDAKNLPGDFAENVPLSKFTSWRVGGIGEYVYRPQSVTDLQQILPLVPAETPITWLGLGSNTLIRDGGLSGLVIVTQSRLNTIQLIDDCTVYAEAGSSCAQVARFSARHHLTGAEFLAGVPGTMGGALAMNAGCFGAETWQQVSHVTLINRQGQLIKKMSSDFKVGYRTVLLPNDHWFVATSMQLQQGHKEHSLAKIRELLDQRSNTQPTGEHSCGSVFRNPSGDYAGRLIETSGLKGYQVGGASVSNKHANFIINKGQATAKDIEQLVMYVQQQVLNNHGVLLQPEVKIIGYQNHEQTCES